MTSRADDTRAHEYELGHSGRELTRLQVQAQLVDPITRQFFHDAGLERGMRALDVGSGGGDTALLAAELVGDGGEVLGVDTSPVAVAAAQNRMSALGKRNISFRQGDPAAVEIAGKFDAVVGRYVLDVQSRSRGDAEIARSAFAAGRRDCISRNGLERDPVSPTRPDLRSVPRLDCSDVQEGRDKPVHGS